MKERLLRISALMLLIWYCFSVIGFNVHTCRASGDSFVTTVLTGLVLNLSGAWDWMKHIGIGGIVTDTFSYLSQPVSMLMLFCVGYNFTLTSDNRKEIFRLVGVHSAVFVGVGLLLQGALFFFPDVDALTRWAMLLYMVLPTSFMVPSLGRCEKDCNITSGVCSVLTAITLVAFCIMAIIVS